MKRKESLENKKNKKIKKLKQPKDCILLNINR